MYNHALVQYIYITNNHITSYLDCQLEKPNLSVLFFPLDQLQFQPL